MKQMKPTNSYDDLVQDQIFISADNFEYLGILFHEVMMECMEDDKASVEEKGEEYAEYEIISSKLNNG